MGLLIGIGCSAPTEPFAKLRVETTVESREGLAPPVTVTTTITNASLRPVTIQTNICPYAFRVETLTGVTVGLPALACAAYSAPRALAPGERFTFHEQWDGKDSTGVTVSGTYRVIGQPFRDSGPHSAPVIVQLPE